MKTALTERLGLSFPLIQAPMAGTSTAELAAPVFDTAAASSAVEVPAIGA